jgi:hypothetical protein
LEAEEAKARALLAVTQTHRVLWEGKPPMTDHYTKAVLTVIAIALVVIAARGFVPQAGAQDGCGSDSMSACYVRTDVPLAVRIVR